MANQQTLQPPTLEEDYSFLMDDPEDSHIDNFGSWGNAHVEGEWFAIQLTPDLATGEVLNIGVGFIDNDAKIHTRLLPNAQALTYMYGRQGGESFGFLLQLVKEYFADNNQFSSPAPQIKLGRLSYASGQSINAILTGLYCSMVSLIADDGKLEKPNQKYAINNKDLRKTFAKLMRTQADSQFKQYFNEAPVTLRDSNNHPIAVDMQIWSPQSDWTQSAVPFGSIISVYYLESVYRGCNLGDGCRDMINTANLLNKKSYGYLGLLAPDDNSPGFSKSQVTMIGNEIDKSIWAIHKNHKNIEIGVHAHTEKLVTDALSIL